MPNFAIDYDKTRIMVIGPRIIAAKGDPSVTTHPYLVSVNSNIVRFCETQAQANVHALKECLRVALKTRGVRLR